MRKILLSAVAIISMSTASMAQSVPNYVPTNGLVGWWPFNGNANDESGNNNNGTVNGATLTADRFGYANKAYSFDGVNDNIGLSNTNVINQISISYWLKISQLGGGSAIIQNNPNPPYNTTFQCFNKAINTQQYILYSNSCTNSQNYWSNTSNSIADQWCNVIYTIDSNSDCKLYFNGNLIGSYNGTNFSNCANLSTTLRFGGIWVSNDPQWFKGQLDDIGIWNRALTQQEITDLYNANICYDHVTVTDTLIINANLVGFNPVTYQNTIKVWPNPVHDHITIDNGNISNLNGYQIKITNVLGQQVFQSAINQQQFYIDLSTWTGNGAYYLNLINPQGVTIETKVIVVQ